MHHNECMPAFIMQHKFRLSARNNFDLFPTKSIPIRKLRNNLRNKIHYIKFKNKVKKSSLIFECT